MTRIDERFATLKREKQKGFIAFITAGDPDLKTTPELVWRLEEAGADVVELGIPFSDPLADGKINQESAARALQSGTTFAGICRAIETIRTRSQIPLLAYSYVNLLLARGFENNARRAAEAGLDAFLILDLPPEEAPDYARVLKVHNLNHICLVAPTSPSARIKRIVAECTGFVYCVSREGVTGPQKSLSPAALDLVRRTRSATRLPVALGFGIADPAQARTAARAADAIVVGSALVARFAEARTNIERNRVQRWLGRMVAAVKEL